MALGAPGARRASRCRPSNEVAANSALSARKARPRVRARRASSSWNDAVHAQPLRPGKHAPRAPGSRPVVRPPAARGGCRRAAAPPHLRGRLVVAGHRRTRRLRTACGSIGVAAELDRAAGVARSVLSATGVPPRVAARASAARAAPASRGRGRRPARVPRRSVLRVPHALGVRPSRSASRPASPAVAQQEVAGGEARAATPSRNPEPGCRVLRTTDRTAAAASPAPRGRSMVPSRSAAGAQQPSSPACSGSTWIEMSCSNWAPLVACRSMVAIGSQAPDQRQHRAHLGRVGLGVVAVEVEFCAVVRQPISSGPRWLGTVPGAEALVAVDVEHRHEHQHLAVQRARAASPSSTSRRARKPASLPSISPAWMPPCTSNTAMPRARAPPGWMRRCGWPPVPASAGLPAWCRSRRSAPLRGNGSRTPRTARRPRRGGRFR
jgi:hypothetical protein